MIIELGKRERKAIEFVYRTGGVKKSAFDKIWRTRQVRNMNINRLCEWGFLKRENGVFMIGDRVDLEQRGLLDYAENS
jgi:hypothetical protein